MTLDSHIPMLVPGVDTRRRLRQVAAYAATSDGNVHPPRWTALYKHRQSLGVIAVGIYLQCTA